MLDPEPDELLSSSSESSELLLLALKREDLEVGSPTGVNKPPPSLPLLLLFILGLELPPSLPLTSYMKCSTET